MGPSHLGQENKLFLSEGLGISQFGKISQQAPKGGAQRYFGLRISHGRCSYRLSGAEGQMQRKGVPVRCKFPGVQLSTEREAVRGASPVWRLSLGRLLELERKTTLARPRLGKESVRNAGGEQLHRAVGRGDGKRRKAKQKKTWLTLIGAWWQGQCWVGRGGGPWLGQQPLPSQVSGTTCPTYPLQEDWAHWERNRTAG